MRGIKKATAVAALAVVGLTGAIIGLQQDEQTVATSNEPVTGWLYLRAWDDVHQKYEAIKSATGDRIYLEFSTPTRREIQYIRRTEDGGRTYFRPYSVSSWEREATFAVCLVPGTAVDLAGNEVLSGSCYRYIGPTPTPDLVAPFAEITEATTEP